MALKNYTGESADNTAGTHTLDTISGVNCADFKSLTVSVRGANAGADIKIAIVDDGIDRWVAWIRSGSVPRPMTLLPGQIITRGNTLTITTGAGGTGCIVVVSAVYLLWNHNELGRT
jgi:protein subunit release factor B